MIKQKPRYFDIHTHVDSPEFHSDRIAVFARMKENDVYAITVGVDRKSSQDAAQISGFVDNVYASVGQHPIDNPHERFDADLYQKMIDESKKVVAIGECGLDYSRLTADACEEEKRRQQALFEEQLELAVRNELPLMIHCRDPRGAVRREAHTTMVEILSSKKREYGDALRGNIHFFTESKDFAQAYLDLGFTMSFTAVITFSRDYDEVIRYIPGESIMVETDAPYVAPAALRGQRNEPSYIVETVKTLAQIRRERLDELSPRLVENAFRVFGPSL